MVVLISPTNFSVPVVQKVVDVGKRKHAQSTADVQVDDPSQQVDGEELIIGNRETKQVIHDMMPKFQLICVDLVEEQSLGLEGGGAAGLDMMAISYILESEHQSI